MFGSKDCVTKSLHADRMSEKDKNIKSEELIKHAINSTNNRYGKMSKAD